MLRIWSLLILFLFIGVSGCYGGPYSSTGSLLKIVEKGYSTNFKETWIIAYDPNNQTKQQTIKIIVEESMVWNLIDINKTYFATYSKVGNDPWILEQISHPDDENPSR
jgi:hypothetical protein